MSVAVVSLLLPVAGFVMLLAVPSADAHWQHGPSHFWLILATALVNVVLGLAASEAARRRRDARAFLVSLAFLVSAGFLGLHALATPGTLVEGRNVGFVIATPIGLVLASCFAAGSSLTLSRDTCALDRRARAGDARRRDRRAGGAGRSSPSPSFRRSTGRRPRASCTGR